MSLLDFLEAGPDQVDLVDFLASSAPATEVELPAASSSSPLPTKKSGKTASASLAPPVGLNGQTVSAKKLPELVTYLSSLSALAGRTHTWSLKRYPSCFTGEELINVLVRNGICPTKEEAEKVGQRLVDEHYVWHTAFDIPFKGNGTTYRFVSPQIFQLTQLMTNPQKGLYSFKTSSAASGKLSNMRKESIGTSSSGLTLFSELRKFTFTGQELCDWLLQHGQLKPKSADQAKRTAQMLLDAFVIQTAGSSTETGVLGTANTYGLSREKVTLVSLSNPSRKEILSCSLSDQIGKSKWRSRLCILMNDQQRLYLFNTDDDDVLPRSIINLCAAIVRVAEESLVGRPNCVQITTDAGVVVLETASEEACAAWAADLSALSVDRTQSNHEVGRQSRSLRVRIVEGKEIAQGGSYYCVVTMADAAVAKTQLQRSTKSNSLAWNEEFFFMEVPATFDDVKVTVWTRGPLQDQEIGSLVINLSSLSSHVEVEEWFTIKPPAKKGGESSDKKTAQPMLFLRLILEYELILPLKSYEPIMTTIITDLKLLSSLLSLTKADREQVTQCTLRILTTQNKAKDFVLELARREITATAEQTVLFRVNTVGTKAVVEYLKLAGVSYIRETLRPFIQGIDKYNIDLDKSTTILQPVKDLFDAIYQSVLRIPSELFLFFYSLSNAAISRFKGDKVSSDDDATTNVGLMVVNGFFFLRLMCAAVVAPKLYGVIDYHPDDKTSRTLKTLARLLQYLANFKAEVDTDVFDAEGAIVLNEFLKENIPRMKSFIRQIANEDNGATQRLNLAPAELNIDLERDLASLYATIIRYNQELFDQINDAATRTNLTNILDDVSKSYKDRWPGRSTPYQYKISLADAMLFLK